MLSVFDLTARDRNVRNGERTSNVSSWPVADIGPSANLNHLLSASVSRVRRWRALVRKREPIVVEHKLAA
jgi:hypothetical protein